MLDLLIHSDTERVPTLVNPHRISQRTCDLTFFGTLFALSVVALAVALGGTGWVLAATAAMLAATINLIRVARELHRARTWNRTMKEPR